MRGPIGRRHAYAIADISYSLAYAFGPIIGDWIYHGSSFLTLNIVIFVVSLLYAPILALLRNVYAYVNFEEDDENAPAAAAGQQAASETKPIATAATTDYRSYMMSAIKSGNGTTQDEPPAYNSVEDGYGRGYGGGGGIGAHCFNHLDATGRCPKIPGGHVTPGTR